MKKTLLLLFSTTLATAAFAQDRIFTHTYQTNVIPYSAMEIEYWGTVRSGRTDFYNSFEHRLELELGTGKNWQTAFYMNISKQVGLTPVVDDHDGHIHYDITSQTNTGFSNEWKWKISDPVVNKVGFGLYGEVGFDGQELELEGKLLFDKKFNRNIAALNLVGEYAIEWEAEEEADGTVEVEAEKEFEFEFDAGFMHMLPSERAGIGLEIVNRNELELKESEWEFSALFAGPTFHFNGPRWFINVSALPQLTNLIKEEGAPSKELVHNEKLRARVLLSFSF